MTIRYLRIFKVICEEKSFTKAAEKLYMTQPAISHIIRDLENEVGFPLFDRIAHKIYLTETGKHFLQKSSQIIELYDELEKGLPVFEENVPLKIGSSITIANFWLPDILLNFQQKHPLTPVKTEVDSAASITSRLISNEIDIALIEGTIFQEQFYKIPFSFYHLSAVCSPMYPLAMMNNISIEDLLQRPLLLREKGSAIRDTFDSFLQLYNLAAEPLWTSVNSQALIQAVKKNIGITVLPDILIQSDLDNGSLCQLDVQNFQLKNENYIVVLKEKRMSKRIIDFINSVKHCNSSENV